MGMIAPSRRIETTCSAPFGTSASSDIIGVVVSESISAMGRDCFSSDDRVAPGSHPSPTLSFPINSLPEQDIESGDSEGVETSGRILEIAN